MRLDYGMRVWDGVRERDGLCQGHGSSCARGTADGGCPYIILFLIATGYFRSSKSPATKAKKRTEITPFMVKNAAFSLLRSSGATRECS